MEEFDTVLGGAGLSMGVISNSGQKMPSGECLARSTVYNLASSGNDDKHLLTHPSISLLLEIMDIQCYGASVADNTSPVQVESTELRLEFLLQSLHDALTLEGCDTRRIEEWISILYEDQVGGGEPDDRHFAAVSLASKHLITLNMDLLLEAAGGKNVLHLHGTYDDPPSIRTTISHYKSGLPAETAERLRVSLDNKRVLVAGYSGRDIDVMPIIQSSAPKSVVWVRHKGSQLSNEVRAAQQSFVRRHLPFKIFDGEITDLVGAGGLTGLARNPRNALNDQESNVEKISISAPSNKSTGGNQAEKSLLTAYQRSAGLLSILLSLDLIEQAGTYSTYLGQRLGILRGASFAYKTRSRILKLEGKNLKAAMLLAVGGTLQSAQRKRLEIPVNELLSTIMRATDSALMEQAWDSVASIYGRTAGHNASWPKRRAASLLRRGQHASTRGRVGKSIYLAEQSVALTPREADSQLRSTVYAFLADFYRSVGEWAQARSAIEEARAELPYSSLHTRYYLEVFDAHLRLLTGDKQGALDKIEMSKSCLNLVRVSSERVVNRRWGALVEVNYLCSIGEYREALSLARVYQGESPSDWDNPMGFFLSRIHQVECRKLICLTQSAKRSDFHVSIPLDNIPRRYPHLQLAARQIIVEYAIFAGRMVSVTKVRADLLQLRDRFKQLGHVLSAGRCSYVLALTRSSSETLRPFSREKLQSEGTPIEFNSACQGLHWHIPF